MSVIYNINEKLESIIKMQQDLLDHLYKCNMNIRDEIMIREKRVYTDALIDVIETVEQIQENIERLKRKNLKLKDSSFCNVDFIKNYENTTEISMPPDLNLEEMLKLKIGEFIRFVINKIAYDNNFTEDELQNLQNGEWCKEVLAINYPVLRKHLPFLSDADQRKVNGVAKYYTQPVQINGIKYFVCSELFERSREPFLKLYNKKYNLDIDGKSIQEIKLTNVKIRVIDLYEINSTRYIINKPCKIQISNKEYYVSSWSDVMTNVCEAMIKQFPEKMSEINYAYMFRVNDRPIFDYDALTLTNPKKLTNDMYVQTTFAPIKIIKYCYSIVEYCGLNEDNLKIYMIDNKEKTNSNISEHIYETDVINKFSGITVRDVDSVFIDELVRVISNI